MKKKKLHLYRRWKNPDPIYILNRDNSIEKINKLFQNNTYTILDYPVFSWVIEVIKGNKLTKKELQEVSNHADIISSYNYVFHWKGREDASILREVTKALLHIIYICSKYR